MTHTIWRTWARSVILIHFLSLIGCGIVYGIIAYAKDAPFNRIFEFPETAPFYLITYVLIMIFMLTLCVVGLILKDIFGHRDLRAQIMSYGMLIIGILGTLMSLNLITMWDMVLNNSSWVHLAGFAQHFGIWVSLTIAILFVVTMLIISFLGREQSQIPNGWANLSLGLAIFGGIVALSCFWIVSEIVLFRTLFLIGAVIYFIWILWLLNLIPKIDRS